MKRTVLFSILGVGLSLTVISSARAQGRIALDNYNTSGPLISYDLPGHPGINDSLPSQWTIGFFWAPGDVRATTGNDPSGDGATSTWANGLTLAGGAGTTAHIVPGYPGMFLQTDANDAVLAGVSSGQVTMAVFAYAGGGSYNTSTLRGHSTAFLITPAQGSNFATLVGSAMPAFLIPIPEPSLAGLGAAGVVALLVQRRKTMAAR